MKLNVLIKSILIVTAAVTFVGRFGQASDLAATGGLSFGSGGGAAQLHSPSPVVGAEYTFHVSRAFSFGGFYDHTFLSYVSGGSGAIHFMGAVARANLFADAFADVKVGLTKLMSDETETNGVSKNVTIGAETGIGYEISLGRHVSLTPRVSVRFLPDPSTSSSELKPTPETSVMLAFHF